MNDKHYTFGDNDVARARLECLARVYEPTSRQLLGDLGLAPERAVDLGCGPGHSTELIHQVLRARETWGLDASESFIRAARDRVGPAIFFAVHDVTATPFPVRDVDLVFSRHLLAHLARPGAALAAWATMVSPGGRLVLEETAALESPDAVFAEYYAHVRALQRHYGQDTFVGSRLADIARETGWQLASFARVRVSLDARAMATLHAMNLRTWGRDAFASAAFDAQAIARMGEALAATAAGERESPPVVCELGQAVLVR
jgi:trans-aconitate methyltransferase